MNRLRALAIFLAFFAPADLWAESLAFRDGKCVLVDPLGKRGGFSECGLVKNGEIEREVWGKRTVRGADLAGLYVRESRFQIVDFDFANLNDSSWHFSRLENAHFFSANLRGIRLLELHCHYCNFENASALAARVYAVRMHHSDFRNSKWDGAFIENSHFENCDFRGASLRKILWLHSRCKNCRADNSTQLPWERAEAIRRGFVFE